MYECANVFTYSTVEINVNGIPCSVRKMNYPDNIMDIFKDIHQQYMKYCHELKKLGGRNANIPEILTENLVAYILDLYYINKQSLKVKTSKSFDLISKDGKLVQVKATTIITDCSSFGPRSEYDIIYFVDLARQPYFEIYELLPEQISCVRMNANETFQDQQKKGKRPHFSIKEKIIQKHHLEPVVSGSLYKGKESLSFRERKNTKLIQPSLMRETIMTNLYIFNKELTIVDFYCGIGGFSRAFDHINSKYKTKTIYAVDFDTKCQHIFDQNFDLKMTLQDISTLKPKDVPYSHILTAGFNCQPFSVAGQRKGFDDVRTESLGQLFEIISVNQPVCIFFENVKGLLTHDKGQSFQRIIETLRQSGYVSIFWKVLNTCEYTHIPQNRERLFIIAFRFTVEEFHFPSKEIPKRISDFLEPELTIPLKYYYTSKSPIYDRLVQSVIDENVVYQYRRGIIRANQSGVVPTLVATMGTGGHNVPIIKTSRGIRKLTPRECFNLQGYVNYDLTGIADNHLYKQAGNGVTVPLVRKIAQEIVRILLK